MNERTYKLVRNIIIAVVALTVAWYIVGLSIFLPEYHKGQEKMNEMQQKFDSMEKFYYSALR